MFLFFYCYYIMLTSYELCMLTVDDKGLDEARHRGRGCNPSLLNKSMCLWPTFKPWVSVSKSHSKLLSKHGHYACFLFKHVTTRAYVVISAFYIGGVFY